mgnify:CR=1 FL=1
MIKVENEKITFRGSEDEIFDELVALFLAGAADPHVRPIFNKALTKSNELLRGKVKDECKDS